MNQQFMEPLNRRFFFVALGSCCGIWNKKEYHSPCEIYKTGGIRMNYKARDVCLTANNFFAASAALNEKIGQTNDIGTYIAPYVTVTSFTIELYLKCIFMLDKGKSAPNIHDLAKLYNSLGDESKIVIEKVYEMAVSHDPIVNAMRAQVPEMITDLNKVFKEISGAFVKWRYSYERKITGFPTSGPIIEALRARVRMIHPDWI
jgi:hypothetical protein